MISKKNKYLCLSPLSIYHYLDKETLLAGGWCIDSNTYNFLKNHNVSFQIAQQRIIGEERYRIEAKLCLTCYNKYIKLLAKELNNLHNKNFSIRYWNTLLHGCLYPIIASTIDHFMVIKKICETNENIVAGIYDYQKSKIQFHMYPGGSSRLFHFLIYSIIVKEVNMIPYEIIDNDIIGKALIEIGDGKKTKNNSSINIKNLGIRSKLKKYGSGFKSAIKGELPLEMARITNPSIVALGNQYLSKTQLNRLLKESGGSNFSFYGNVINTDRFNTFNLKCRKSVKFNTPKSILEKALQQTVLTAIPTLYIENYHLFRKKVKRWIPKKKATILNSQNCTGGEAVNFFIGESMENAGSQHIMICHGGCYGVMDISIQEQIWAQISDIYAMWSKKKSYDDQCNSIKLPSLRFHEKQNLFQKEKLGNDILLLVTGHYPNRYAYNSIFPYTIDESYDRWQLRFLRSLSKDNCSSLVIRDFHRSERISAHSYLDWARENSIRVTSREQSFLEAVRSAKLSIQTVPQTTYLETIVADHPTVCFWNPNANYIRHDLRHYYSELEGVGVIHYTPESAAVHINEISENPLAWWKSEPVRKSLHKFRNNVCYTSPNAIATWADFIKKATQDR